MAKPRQAQVDALNFIYDAIVTGYEDIVIAAPTGIGKTGIGAAFSFWANTLKVDGWASGSYYLVTQKMLQEQLERDFSRFTNFYERLSGGLKSAADYPCDTFGTCGIGGLQQNSPIKCRKRSSSNRQCPYLTAKLRFDQSAMAVTNYPYIFTEHTHVKKLPGRVGLVADECHTLERQITSFIEVTVDDESLQRWAPQLKRLTKMDTLPEFKDWLSTRYVDALTSRLEMLTQQLAEESYAKKSTIQEHTSLDNHLKRTQTFCARLESDSSGWIYWQESDKDRLKSIAKPISAAPYVSELIGEMAAVRLYMSAYPGPKSTFCRNLGLDPKATAWLELDSPFPAENRPVNIFDVGSMGRRDQERTLPALMKAISIILDGHADEKGIVHCNSYSLGKQIYDFIRAGKHAARVIFPVNADQRRNAMQTHRSSKVATVIISPSMAEGYSFDDDLARFQIIAKVPYPYLGDKQVAARKEQDPDWYIMHTVMTILQACGRVVRSETDFGSTYILDSDFRRLLDNHPQFFPDWFTKSFK